MVRKRIRNHEELFSHVLHFEKTNELNYIGGYGE